MSALQGEVAGSAAPAEPVCSAAPAGLVLAICDRDLAGAEMPSVPIAAAMRSVRVLRVRQKAAAGGDRVTMRALVIKARGAAPGRVPGRVVATNNHVCVHYQVLVG